MTKRKINTITFVGLLIIVVFCLFIIFGFEWRGLPLITTNPIITSEIFIPIKDAIYNFVGDNVVSEGIYCMFSYSLIFLIFWYMPFAFFFFVKGVKK